MTETTDISAVDGGPPERQPRAEVLLAAADESLRAEWTGALERRAPSEDVRTAFHVCASVATAPEAVRAAAEMRPEVCLIAARITGDGMAAAWEVGRTMPRAQVVVLGDMESDRDLFGALRAGAAGCLPIDVSPKSLPRILQAVLDGEAALPRAVVRRITERFRDRRPGRPHAPDASDPGEPLTGREWDVLDLLVQGHSTHEIAEELTIADVTVRTHVAAVLRKLQVPDREALRERALRNPNT